MLFKILFLVLIFKYLNASETELEQAFTAQRIVDNVVPNFLSAKSELRDLANSYFSHSTDWGPGCLSRGPLKYVVCRKNLANAEIKADYGMDFFDRVGIINTVKDCIEDRSNHYIGCTERTTKFYGNDNQLYFNDLFFVCIISP